MSHGVVCKYHYRENFRVWLTSVTVWLFFREGVAKCPCKCGSVSEIYRNSGDGFYWTGNRWVCSMRYLCSSRCDSTSSVVIWTQGQLHGNLWVFRWAKPYFWIYCRVIIANQIALRQCETDFHCQISRRYNQRKGQRELSSRCPWKFELETDLNASFSTRLSK